MNKSKIYHLLLGIGLGIIITSSLNIAFNKTEVVEYTDEQIKEKAETLGMISIKENIEKNDKEKIEKAKKADKSKEESKAKAEVEKEEQVQKDPESKPQVQEDHKLIVIGQLDTASSIISKLKSNGIIDSENEFKNLVIKFNLQRKFRTGTYEIKENSTYEEVLKKLIQENELKNAGFL